jgi:single-strand DNA-binding protein
MSASFNQCVFSGNLTRDAEIRQAAGKEVGQFGIAVNGRKDDVWFLDCEYWSPGKVMEYLTKGTKVIVGGELRVDTWERDGVKRSKNILTVRSLTLLGGNRKEESKPAETAPW